MHLSGGDECRKIAAVETTLLGRDGCTPLLHDGGQCTAVNIHRTPPNLLVATRIYAVFCPHRRGRPDQSGHYNQQGESSDEVRRD